jgi:hypothetical protein
MKVTKSRGTGGVVPVLIRMAGAVGCALLLSTAKAQMSTLAATEDTANFPGPPTNPPIFSEATAIWQGSLQFQSSIDVRGPVASIVREEIRPPGQKAFATTRLEFDQDGHLKKSILEESMGEATTLNEWVNGRLQSQTVHHHRTDRKTADWDDWQHRVYDADGRLSELHSGRDNAEWNDYLNFKYDADGRLLGYEYRVMKAAGQTTFTEISYSGNTVTLSRFDSAHGKLYEQVQAVDDRNRVVDLRVSDLSAGQLKQWYRARFKYDDKDRVVEQDTDPFTLGEGDDYSPMPGKLVVEYDDLKQSGQQEFFDADGKLALHTIFSFDRDGIFTSLRVLDASGKERIGKEPMVDPQSHQATTRPGSVKWEVIYDSHGNWTERRRWFTPADGSPRIMMLLIRQSITYR